MSILKNYLSNEKGNFAVTFSLALLPIAGGIGMAVDYSRLTNNRSMVQEVLDAAVLETAIEYQKNKDKSAAKKLGKDMFTAQCYMPYCNQVEKPKFKISDDEVFGKVKAKLDTSFIHLIGQSKWKFTAKSTAKLGSKSSEPFELAIAMDTTSSMKSYGSNWSKAVAAFGDMITVMQAGQKKGESTVGFIPFSDRVNPGKKLAKKWHNAPGKLSQWDGCLEPREAPEGKLQFMLNDDSPKTAAFKPTAKGYWGPVNHSKSPACTQEFSTPTTNAKSIENAMKKISPSGTGRFDIGLAWAWRMLSPKWKGEWGLPNYPADYKKKRKLIIFLTDGYSYAYEREVYSGGPKKPWGWNKGTPEAFEHFEQLCQNIKDEGIELHMIYLKGNKHFKPAMKKCASPDSFYTSVGVKDLEKILDNISGAKNNDIYLAN